MENKFFFKASTNNDWDHFLNSDLSLIEKLTLEFATDFFPNNNFAQFLLKC